ncbi:MAG: hypothetical protein ACRYG2_14370, partial [Janthinobacterium lividum]
RADGVRLMPTQASPMGGTALPLEDGRWLVGAEGYGTDRPGRGEADLDERGPPHPRSGRPERAALDRWVDRVVRLAMTGEPVCAQALADVYHLMQPPSSLLGPRVTAAVVCRWRSASQVAPPRPDVLAALRR